MNVFDYTSGKIKLVAKIYFWSMSIISTLALFIGFVIGIAKDMLFLAFGCFFMIPVLVFSYWWIGLIIYGFGRLIDNTDEIRYQMEHLDE